MAEIDLCDVENNILDMVREGKTLLDVAASPGIVSGIGEIAALLSQEGFRKSYEEAKKIRAEILAEEALTTGRLTDKSTAMADKLAIETIKWKCSIDHPEVFGKATKEDAGDGSVLVYTGILRPGDEGYASAFSQTQEALKERDAGNSDRIPPTAPSEPAPLAAEEV